MERKPPSSLGEIFAVIDRRKFWIVVPFAIVLVLGIGLSPLVPRTYQSTATIMVAPPNMPSAFVHTATPAEVANRIQDLSLEVTNGDGLIDVMNNLNLYPKLRRQGKTNEIVDRMRKNTVVAQVPDTGDGRGGVGAFTVSFIGDTPQQAQAVTRELTDFFVHNNSTQVHRSAQGTDAFLSAQLAEAGRQLAAQQAKIQAFKDAHLGSLPEQAQVNLTMIGQYQTELQADSAALDQDNQQRVYLQSVLNVNPGTDQNDAAAPPEMTPLEVELAQDRQELSADLLKYTPQHPDVIRLKRDIAALKFQIRHAPRSTAAATLPQMQQVSGPSVNDQLRSQLVALNTEIKARQERSRQVESELTRLQGSIGALPAVQTQFESLDSEYQEMQKNYDTLLEKQHEAGMAVALDQRDPRGQLVVIQPASLPLAPYRPDPVLLYLGIVLVGLLVGLILGLVAEMGDDTLHDADEVAAYLKLPVIVALPSCPSLPDGREN